MAAVRTVSNRATFRACAGLSLVVAGAIDAAVIFVDADAPNGGNGLSWVTAFNDLQDALAVAVGGDEIWVAEGVYLPDDSTGDRTRTFTLKAQVPVYGGFAGDETSFSQRDWTVNFAILSGDLNEDDGSNFVNYADNSFNVVTSGPSVNGDTIVLDGFIVEGGNADGSSTGGGTFGLAVEYPVDLGPTCLLALDLNNDGAVDVTSVNKKANTASVLVNEGNSTFSSAVHFVVGVEPRDIAAMDAELDGDADLFIVADIAGEPFVQLVRNDLNNGQLLFAVARAISTEGNALLVRSGDVDDDAIPDLIAVNEPPEDLGPAKSSVASLLNVSAIGHQANVTDFTVAFGSLISGTLQDLVDSDDLRLRTRSIPGFTSEEANLMELRVGAVTTVQSPGTLDLTLEGRISQPGGTVRVRFRNWPATLSCRSINIPSASPKLLRPSRTSPPPTSFAPATAGSRCPCAIRSSRRSPSWASIRTRIRWRLSWSNVV